MNRRPVRVAVHKNVDVALAKRADDGILIDVHDVFADRSLYGLALLARVLAQTRGVPAAVWRASSPATPDCAS